MRSKINSFKINLLMWTWSLLITFGGLVLDFISDWRYDIAVRSNKAMSTKNDWTTIYNKKYLYIE